MFSGIWIHACFVYFWWFAYFSVSPTILPDFKNPPLKYQRQFARLVGRGDVWFSFFLYILGCEACEFTSVLWGYIYKISLVPILVNISSFIKGIVAWIILIFEDHLKSLKHDTPLSKEEDKHGHFILYVGYILCKELRALGAISQKMKIAFHHLLTGLLEQWPK